MCVYVCGGGGHYAKYMKYFSHKQVAMCIDCNTAREFTEVPDNFGD